MRIPALAILLSIATSMALPVRSADIVPDKQAAPQAHKATGKVVKVDFVMDELTIVHDPVPSLSWPVMKMEFKVKDKSMLDRVRPGSKVEFTFVESGKEYVIVEIK